ncbi:hypothetical protein ABZ912_05210 [Nonomuraea angiospora]|uniref:hypothetical protein n=1 Tax=Nonomuraea angiospora TaxID=46172 RepID=UPI003408F4B4
MRKTATALVLASAFTASAAITASAAYADLGDAQAPNARAVAIVNANGTVVRSKGVTGVQKLDVGQYCVQLDSDYDASKAVPVANVRWLTVPTWNSGAFVEEAGTRCGAGNRYVLVRTGNGSGPADASFSVIVP